MFIMMNAARFGVGLEGVAAFASAPISARATTRATASSAPTSACAAAESGDHQPSRCAPHADDHASHAEATRALAYVVAAAARRRGPPSGRRGAQAPTRPSST
jgi:hypothetical protein